MSELVITTVTKVTITVTIGVVAWTVRFRIIAFLTVVF